MIPVYFLCFLIIMCVITIGLRKEGKMKWIEGRIVDTVLFLLTSMVLFISIGLFIQLGIYVDNYQIRGDMHLVTGGQFWTYMRWLEFPILLCLIFILGIRITRQIKWIEGRSVDIALFLLSAVALFTTFGLFMNSAIYVSNHQYGGGTTLLTGGWFWLNMKWLELPTLLCLSFILGNRIIKSKK